MSSKIREAGLISVHNFVECASFSPPATSTLLTSQKIPGYLNAFLE
ncbi:hypothetical protein [Niastella caeni]|nr:hypothetical protein [Niastella caeni]